MLIKERTFEFALKILLICKELQNQKEYILSKQLLRSGTSIGANLSEAEAGQSKADFIAKMSISSKEARETLYWIQLLKASNLYSIDFDSIEKEAISIVNILTKIVKTSQMNHFKTKK
jgi:four helix bundle protein